MPVRLDSRSANFAETFSALVDARREADSVVVREVSAIIARVREEGDSAIVELTERFDAHRLGWRIAPSAACSACAQLEDGERTALELAAQRITDYHERMKPHGDEWIDSAGVSLGYRWSAVEAAGIYVPGGQAAYPSSVLMNAIPAKVAGVERLVMVTPTPRGEINPIVLAAAHIAGVDEVWRIGGAQAIAALAFGTESIAAVDVITGPGNAWVAEAKRQLYGVVGIDMVAGPSEILVVADSVPEAEPQRLAETPGASAPGSESPGASAPGSASVPGSASPGASEQWPEWLAADLLSQAEHDASSQAILMTADSALADAVEVAIERQLAHLATGERARASWEKHGAIIVLGDLDEAPRLIDRLAPEHLELAVENPDELFARIRHAGSVFLGRYTPEAIGDYLAGPNHVLPTGRRARFSSGLSVSDFMKRTSYIRMDRRSLTTLGPAAVRLAEAEGLPAHADSVKRRLA